MFMVILVKKEKKERKKKEKKKPPTCLLTLHSKRIADTFYAQCVRLSGFGPCSFTENTSYVLMPVSGDLQAEPGAPHSDDILRVLCFLF